MRRVGASIHPFWIRIIRMSTDSPKPGPHLHPSTRPAIPAHTRPATPEHTRLAAFDITGYPTGSKQRAIAAEFAELAAKVDDLCTDDGLAWATADALERLVRARDAAVYTAWRAEVWTLFRDLRDARQTGEVVE